MDYVYDGYLDVMMIEVRDYTEEERKVMVKNVLPSFELVDDEYIIDSNQYEEWLARLFTYNEQEKVRHAHQEAFESFSFDVSEQLSFDKDIFVTLFIGALQLFGSPHLTKHILGAYGSGFQLTFLNKAFTYEAPPTHVIVYVMFPAFKFL